MRVLVLSDTHLSAATLDRMPADVWSMADEAQVILHAGDLTDEAVLHELRAHATTTAVLGNNDHGLQGIVPDIGQIEIDGVRVGMVHDSGARAGRAARMARLFPDMQAVVFGHSHEPVLERTEHGQLLLNPGSPTQRRRQPVHTVGWLELDGGEIQRAEIVPVGPYA